MNEKKHARFSSRWGFILSAVGSAVGMANVWGFPAKLGANGGGAFLVAYLIFVALFCVVGLSAEYAVGRRFRAGAVGSYRQIWRSRWPKLGNRGGFWGWLSLTGMICIAIGYAVIVAYVLKAFVQSITGELMLLDTKVWFESFSSTSYAVVPFHVIVVVGTLLTLLLGAKSIEKTNKIMMPVFFIIFVVLAIRVAFLPGAAAGYKFMFTPDWSALKNPMVWIWAMGQAFFSLSLTGCGMVVYGSYLDDGEDVIPLAIRTAVFDTIAAMVAALVIIPACFAYGLDVGSGAPLLFVTLPRILQDIPFGRAFAVILFTAMIFAGVSSLQNMFEAVAEALQYRFPKFKRIPVLILLGLICLGVGLHMEPINTWGPWMDIVSIYIIPIGATLGAVTWFWVMKKEDLLSAVNKGAPKPHGSLWYNVGRYVYVVCALILCLVALFMKVAF
ncbi:MAG: sodium-dependent transporter [Oscillospiraceae bacterium]|nr:sodium-dependent transporter [Oscillospiraceae bacterium]